MSSANLSRAYLESASLSSSDFWHNRSEYGNFNQMHDPELIKEEKRKVIEAEIRVKVRRRLQHTSHHCKSNSWLISQQNTRLLLLSLKLTFRLVLTESSMQCLGLPHSLVMFCSHQVDEQMRHELAEWKLSVDKDKGGKTKANAKVPD